MVSSLAWPVRTGTVLQRVLALPPVSRYYPVKTPKRHAPKVRSTLRNLPMMAHLPRLYPLMRRRLLQPNWRLSLQKRCAHGTSTKTKGSIGEDSCVANGEDHDIDQCPEGMKWYDAGDRGYCIKKELCPHRFYSSDGYVPCSKCNFGTTSTLHGSTQCEAVTAEPDPVDGNDDEAECREGEKWILQDGRGICIKSVPCPIGLYSEDGFTPCSPCGEGKTTNKAGSVECVDRQDSGDHGDNFDGCPPGQFSSTGQKPCELCPKGTPSDSPLGSTKCRACHENQYAPHEGSPYCGFCSPGEVSNTERTKCIASSARDGGNEPTPAPKAGKIFTKSCRSFDTSSGECDGAFTKYYKVGTGEEREEYCAFCTITGPDDKKKTHASQPAAPTILSKLPIKSKKLSAPSTAKRMAMMTTSSVAVVLSCR